MAYHCGYSVHGITDTVHDLKDLTPDADRANLLKEYAFDQARLTSASGGNALRVFYANSELCSAISGRFLIPSLMPIELSLTTWHLLTRSEKLKLVSEVAESTSQLADAIAATNSVGDGLNFADLDAYLGGIRTFNSLQSDPNNRVRVLLTNVVTAPVPILECPNDRDLEFARLPFRFAGLFARFCEINSLIARKIASRYCSANSTDNLVLGFEINNEPDYEWLPDEQRIERSKSPASMAVHKYITELHQPQIPNTFSDFRYTETTPWGGYQEQTGNWAAPSEKHIPVLEFPWGPKYDWYIKCYAEWAKHVSFAFHDQRAKLRKSYEIVAAGVTHNNIDFLIRVHQAQPEAFKYCSAIAFHPYHWPEHNIHDKKFKDRTNFENWRKASPREFAARYFKCFDFFKEFREYTIDRQGRWPGFKGKKIWLTEFGLGTKLHGNYNSINPQYVPFIRPARMPAEALPRSSAVWEDIWDAFLADITPEYLRSLGVEAIFFYALRETGIMNLDKHDDDRTNFAILDRYGQPRMRLSTFERLTKFIRNMTGRKTTEEVKFQLTPAWARWRQFSPALLRSEPWRYIDVPASVFETLSMLSAQEKQFLYWVTSEFYQGRGAIVDAGCFAGGSTVALASGLLAHWPEADHVVRSYDIFLVDDYMREHYFERSGKSIEGNRFRNVFDDQTRNVSSKVIVTDGDITSSKWAGDKIEILFLDVCKSWEVNDFVVKEFFTRLIPGHSLLIQQDFFHNWEFWIIATMELLIDKFEFVAHVPINTAVFRCTKQVNSADFPVNLRNLGIEKLEQLIKQHIARYQDPFQRTMLTTALACLYRDFGLHTKAVETAHQALTISSDHWVRVAVEEMERLIPS